MDAQAIITAIQGVGFPIVAFLLVYKTLNEQNERWTEKIADMTKSLIELTEAVNSQSEILQTIVAKEVSK